MAAKPTQKAVGHILVVEDEEHLAESIVENLELEGYRTTLITRGDEALERLQKEHENFDLVLLDIMLPGVDGYTICSLARDRGVRTPVIFLTARGAVDDRVRGLQAGGDDYLAKPFHLDELLARIQAVLRRTLRSADLPSLSSAEFGGNNINFASYEATTWRGEQIELSHKEAGILNLLVSTAGQVVSRDQILDRVWGYDSYPSSRTIDNFVVRLRRSFERDPEQPSFIKTVRGVGYRFVDESGDADADGS